MNNLTVVNEQLQFPKVTLVPPAQSGYILIAAEIDRRPPFLRNSRRKRRLIGNLKEHCQELQNSSEIASAVVFDALLIPPGRGRFLRERSGNVRIARYDLAVLIEATSPAALEVTESLPAFCKIMTSTEAVSSYTLKVRAANVRRIESVNHDAAGVFLFNYFFADDTSRNLAVWEYTAGWFQKETGLDNSTVLLPLDERIDYKIINHCRWDRLSDILPSLLFKRTFHNYVLENFAANQVAAMPILYKLA